MDLDVWKAAGFFQGHPEDELAHKPRSHHVQHISR